MNSEIIFVQTDIFWSLSQKICYSVMTMNKKSITMRVSYPNSKCNINIIAYEILQILFVLDIN